MKKFDFSLYYDKPNYRIYVRTFSGKRIDKEHPQYEFASKFESKVRDIVMSRLPFHLQSTRLGLDFTNLATHDQLLREVVTIVNSKGEPRQYSLPRYYKRYFFYDVVENELDGKRNKFVLNEEGKKHLIERLDLSLSTAVLNYKSVLLNTQLVGDDILPFINQVCHVGFSNRYDLQYFMTHCDVDLKILAIYDKCFRNRICPFKFNSVPLSDDIVKDNYLDYFEWCLYEVSQYDYGKLYEKIDTNGEEFKSKSDFFSLMSWNCHPYFSIYEDVLTIIEALDVNIRTAKARAQREKEENTRKLREVLNNLNNNFLN